MGNSVWGNPASPNNKHHTEESYAELSRLGFNSVRFYINYGLFESDSSPYNYKESGFEWLDKNIEWAKKYDIGIILNMHFPQGGYQSSGYGMELWNDTKNQDRLTALWAAIAERYADEPSIWGYSILNEPFLPILDSNEATKEQYVKLAQRITKAIRDVSPNQAVFVERICNMRDINGIKQTDWVYFSDLDNAFPLIEDDNVIYEFHTYDPINFTHQAADWAGQAGVYMTYPSEEVITADYENSWVGCIRATERSREGEWAYFESEPLTLTEESNVGIVALNGANTGDGAAYYDDVTVTRISPDGQKSVIFTYDFNEGGTGRFYAWSSDGTGEMTHSEDGRSGGCLKISGAKADFNASGGRFELTEGCKYIISGYIRKENVFSYPTVRLDYAKASRIYTFNKDYLERVIKPYADFSEKHNVPVYIGEFGVIAEGFKENRGGEKWVSDMLDLCYKYNIGFNYHTYHEPGFGLYRSADTVLPDEKDMDKALAEVFQNKLIQQ